MSSTRLNGMGSPMDEVIAALRKYRQLGKEVPSERSLSETLGIKRHQVRKAILALRESGELATAQSARPGPTIGEDLVRLTSPIEVLELRLLMEPGLARMASLRASGVEISRILEAATTPTNMPPGEVDLAFHFAVAAAARNQLASEFYRMLRQVGFDARMRVARLSSSSCPKRIAQRDAEHRRVAEAIALRDPDAADAAMRAHLHSVQMQLHQVSGTGSFAA